MPIWSAESELWMQRMLHMVAPNLAAICAERPLTTAWDGVVPTVSITPSFSRLERVAIRLGLMPARGRLDQLRDALNKFRPKTMLIHYLHYAMTFEPVISACSQNVFIHCHGCDVSWDLRNHETPENRVYESSYTTAVVRLSKRAVLIANSQHTKKQLLAMGVSSDRIVVKHLGVPIPLQPRKRQFNDSIRILYLGRLVDFKGPDLTISAFELACDRGFKGELVIAGNGELRVTCELMQKRSRYAKRIHLLGAVDAQKGAELRASSDIFTAHNCEGPLTHQVEAFGVSVVEAMADSLPIVGGRSGGLLETVVDGDTGILVEPGDVEGQAEAFLSLSRDPDRRRTMGEAAWLRAKEHFSFEKERCELLRILNCTAPIIKTPQ
jgi:colanic acid/amylovoran biosynthesis glycosyltransferase